MYTTGILVWTILHTFTLHRLNLNWQLSFSDAIISAVILAFFCFDLIIIFSYYQPKKENHIYRLVFVSAFAFLYGSSVKWILEYVFSGNTNYISFLEQSMPVRFSFSFMVLLFVAVIHWILNILLQQKEKEKRRNDSEQLAKETELASLRQKLQPHFLFNSLNSISALALSKPEDARKMIQQLSDFLRGTLKKEEQKLIPVTDELNHLNLYLEIEKVRFGHRLNIVNRCDEKCNSASIPPLLIQPIVENAIKFGLYDTLDATTIFIKTYIENNYLIVQIKNPFDKQTQNANTGTGFGLSSIQRRLFLIYGRNDLLVVEKKEEQFITTLKIPQQ